MRDYKSNQDEPGNEKDCRWNQVWPEMIDPPAGDPWNGKHDCDDQNAFARCDGKDRSKTSTNENKIDTNKHRHLRSLPQKVHR